MTINTETMVAEEKTMSEKFTRKDWMEVLKILGYPILLIVGLLLGLMIG